MRLGSKGKALHGRQRVPKTGSRGAAEPEGTGVVMRQGTQGGDRFIEVSKGIASATMRPATSVSATTGRPHPNSAAAARAAALRIRARVACRLLGGGRVSCRCGDWAD